MKRWGQRQTGFTIVELLLVVVVIAILAAITIVAYNGISQRAKVSALQGQLSQTARKLETVKVSTSAYPGDTAALAAQGINTTGVSVYIVNNTTSPANYCLTVTNGTLRYSITSTARAPLAGECVTNLVQDPRAVAYGSGPVLGFRSSRWFGASPASGVYDLVANATDGPLADITTYARKRWTTSPPSIIGQGDSGYDLSLGGLSGLPIAAGESYAVSAYMRASTPKTGMASIYPSDSTGATLSRVYGNPHAMPANTWVRQTYVYTAAAGVAYFRFTSDVAASGSNNATLWAPNDTLHATAGMITKGSTLYQYGDGDSPGWFWNGVPNSSTSTGPAVAQ